MSKQRMPHVFESVFSRFPVRTLAAVLLLLIGAIRVNAFNVLDKDKKMRTEIVNDMIIADETIAFAMSELSLWPGKIADQAIPIVKKESGGEGMIPIYAGTPESSPVIKAALAKENYKDSIVGDGYVIRMSWGPRRLLIAAKTPQGVLNGVYRVLKDNTPGLIVDPALPRDDGKRIRFDKKQDSYSFKNVYITFDPASLAHYNQSYCPAYKVKKASSALDTGSGFLNAPQWAEAHVMPVDFNFTGADAKRKDPAFFPETTLRLLYDKNFVYGLFEVKDRYIKSVHTGYQASTCLDSCVELFLRPPKNERYYNFEINAGAQMLLYRITDINKGALDKIPEEDFNRIKIRSTLPATVDPEIEKDLVWKIAFAIPVSFFVKYGENVNADLSGQTWTGNAYKCGDKTSNPHWLGWHRMPFGDFHMPQFFGDIVFE